MSAAPDSLLLAEVRTLRNLCISQQEQLERLRDCLAPLASGEHFICIHCNRLVERATYEQHHCPMLDKLREFVRAFNGLGAKP